MIHLLIDIAYFGQLRRIDPSFMDDLLAHIDRILQEGNARSLSRHMPLHYIFDDTIPGIRLQAAQAAYAATEILAEARERLTGYNLVLDGYDKIDHEQASGAFKAMVLTDAQGQRLLIGKNLRDDFSEFFTIEEDGPNLWASDFRFTHPVSGDEDQSFWIRPSLVSAIQDQADPWFRGEKTGRGLIFLSPRRLPGMRIIERAIDPLLGPAQPPRFRPAEGLANPLAGISSRILQSDVATAGSRLGVTERAVFDSSASAWAYVKASPYKAIIPAETQRRFASFLELFLLGYARDRQARGLPAPILLEDADRMPAEALSLLSSVLSRFPGGSGPFLLANAESLPRRGLSELALEEIELPPPLESEALSYAERYFPALSGSQALEGIIRRWGDQGLTFYLALLNRRSSQDPLQAYLKTLPSELLEILYLSCLASCVLGRRELRDFLASTGRRVQTQEMSFLQLSQMGLLLSPEEPEPGIPGMADKVAAILGDKAGELRAVFFFRLIDLSPSGLVDPSLDLLRLASEAGAKPGLDAVLRAILRERSVGNLAPALASAGIEGLVAREESDVREIACVKAWASFLEAAERGECREILARQKSLELIHPQEGCRLAGHRALGNALCAHMSQDDKSSLNEAKRALMTFQSMAKAGALPPREDESAAHRALGLHFLRQGLIFDAMDYFENALSAAEASADHFGSALSSYFTAVAFYLHGNASRALRQCMRAAQAAQAAFRPDWEAQSLLLEGRIEFDLGRLDLARDAWGRGRCAALLGGLDAAQARFEIMESRCHSLAGAPEVALAILEAYPADPEAILLRAEASLLLQDYDQARADAEKAMRVYTDSECLFPEAIRFDNSFCMVEDLCFGRVSAERSFGLWALCLRSEACWFQGDWEEASVGLQRLTRGIKLSDLDPSIMRWWYAAFRCQNEAGSKPGPGSELQADRGTLLSKAFKHLQLRASRIDTAQDKHAYMEQNPLNRELLEEARRYKYI